MCSLLPLSHARVVPVSCCVEVYHVLHMPLHVLFRFFFLVVRYGAVRNCLCNDIMQKRCSNIVLCVLIMKLNLFVSHTPVLSQTYSFTYCLIRVEAHGRTRWVRWHDIDFVFPGTEVKRCDNGGASLRVETCGRLVCLLIASQHSCSQPPTRMKFIYVSTITMKGPVFTCPAVIYFY